MAKALYPPMNGQGPSTVMDDPEIGGSIGRMVEAATDHVKAKTAETKAGIAGGVLKGLFGGDTQTSGLNGVGELMGGMGKAWEGLSNSHMAMNQFLMSMMQNPLLQKGNGNTDSTAMMFPWMMSFMLYMTQNMQQPKQESTLIPIILDYMNKIVEQNNLRWEDREKYHQRELTDWQQRANYQSPIDQQFQSQILPAFLGHLVEVNQKSPLDHLKELKGAAEELGGTFNLFGNNGGSLAEKIQMETLGMKKQEIFSNERVRMAEINAGHKKWKHIGNTLGAIFGDNGGGGNPLVNFASMAQRLAGGGQPDQGAM